MPITSVDKDLEALTLTVVADFPVPVRRLWDAYADPRQIEKFWGPVEWPATFTRHDMAVGGRSNYTMTGPDGETSSGYWEFTAVDEGRSFEVLDGFANDDGEPNTEMPNMRMRFSFTETPQGSRLTTTTQFGSLEQLEQLIGMGMEEGMRSAMSQIDAVVADLASFAAGRGVEVQTLSDTQVRITRVIRGTVEQVWRAHHEPELLRQWMLGPDGWRMSECIVAESVGDSFRNAWEPVDGSEGAFAFTGELLESAPPHREVTTELMEGTPGPGARNELTLTAVEGGTLLSLVITYPDKETRDMVLDTGMADGMEASYARLESEVFASV
ncbi:SRPBCC family protein [Salinibacterium sp. SYSU T00001]|uniref:SRPBCC family protein n=1 Tax=Homoserinimonas sedimenticola TaxID=2986805 RepID=UPI002235C484|nr:SRPBCC family protein [Salinibacterium sedimenticola]MCW4385570.1 SRPBCC family protein [Salinibacterium sedimenticola]